MRTIHGILLLGGLAASALACSDDTTPPPPEGAGGGSSSTTTSSTAQTTTVGSGGSFPVHPGVLVEEGLITRYYLDEADSGQGPTEVVDAAPDPLNLPLIYVPELTYATDANDNHGLRFSTLGLDGRASIAVDGTKVASGLQTSKTGTIEVVAELSDVSPSASRLSHIGLDANSGRFTISTGATGRMFFRVNDTTACEVPFDFAAAGRVVVHAVLDSTQTEADDRARIYVNGGRLPNHEATAVPLDAVLDLGLGTHYVIGNREIGGRTIQGTIYYSALYSAALTPEQVAQNAALLESMDDTPSD